MGSSFFGRSSRSKSMHEQRSSPATALSGRPAAPPSPIGGPSSAAAADGASDASLSARTTRLQDRLASHNRELLRLRGELRATKPGTRQHSFYARRAAQILAQKKSLEKRLAAAMNMRYNLTIAQDEADASAALAALQPARGELGELRAGRAMLDDVRTDPEEVDEVLEDIRERIGDINEISQMLAREDLFDDDLVDEEELEAELMRDMDDMPPTGEAEQAGDDEDYMRRLGQLMPTPNQTNPNPYRLASKPSQGRGKQSRQQKPSRKGGA